MERYWTELKWLAFQVQYCLGGGNLFDSRLCRDFRPWAIAVIAALAAVVFVTAWHFLARKVSAWRLRRRLARVADKETMDRYRWTGDAPKK
jgi:hypothetical protein